MNRNLKSRAAVRGKSIEELHLYLEQLVKARDIFNETIKDIEELITMKEERVK